MINVSNEFISLMNERTDFRCEAEITLANGTVLEPDDNDFTIGGNKVIDGAGSNSLPLGVAVGRSIKISLMNDDGRFDDYSFLGARIRLSLTFALSNSTEHVRIGTFTVVTPETRGSTVIISASDDMYRADREYNSTILFPATIGDMFRDACTSCGIPFVSSSFTNSDFVVDSVPNGIGTYRDAFGYIAQIAAGNARINNLGNMEIISYAFSGTSHSLSGWSSLKIDTDDIIITGIKTSAVVELEDGGSYEQEIVSGADGYVLSIKNPLIVGKEQSAVNLIADTLVGATIRKFDGSYTAYPIAEFMDLVTITDRKGNSYLSVITDIEFVFGGFTSMANSAESSFENAIVRESTGAKTITEAKRLIAAERSSRETAIASLNEIIANSSGLYTEVVPQEDGSNIFYAHDKPTAEESAVVISVTGSAMGVTVKDGDQEHVYGFSIDGRAIIGILEAEGVNANWIRVNGVSFADFFDVSMVNGHPVVRIGSSENGIILKQMSDKIAFCDANGNELAFWTNNSFELVELKKFRLGNLSLISQPNGSVSFVGV